MFVYQPEANINITHSSKYQCLLTIHCGKFSDHLGSQLRDDVSRTPIVYRIFVPIQAIKAFLHHTREYLVYIFTGLCNIYRFTNYSHINKLTTKALTILYFCVYTYIFIYTSINIYIHTTDFIK